MAQLIELTLSVLGGKRRPVDIRLLHEDLGQQLVDVYHVSVDEWDSHLDLQLRREDVEVDDATDEGQGDDED